MDYKDKIRKLLAVSKSKSDAEAQTALLKARELMAKYKLTEEECSEVLKKGVVKLNTGVSCTKTIGPWMIALSGIIAEAYRCENILFRRPGSKTYDIGFVGMEDDAGLCEELFKFAVDNVQERNKNMSKALHKEYKGYKIATYVRDRANSYGFGFAAGLKHAFDLQTKAKTQEWGLVLQTPQEVKDILSGMSETNFSTKYDNVENVSGSDYCEGEVDGKRFSTKSTLRSGEKSA